MFGNGGLSVGNFRCRLERNGEYVCCSVTPDEARLAALLPAVDAGDESEKWTKTERKTERVKRSMTA